MSSVVKNNLPAQLALGELNKNVNKVGVLLGKIANGQKINSAKDDAGQFAISEKMREQIRSMIQDTQNIQNASALIKVAEGAVSSTVDILRTIKEKAIDAANDTNTDIDRKIIQKEIDQFMDQVNDNALVTFNGKYLIDGSTSEVEGGVGSASAAAENAQNAIIKGLNSEWVQGALDLVNESFGLGFESAGANVREITVHFDEQNSSSLAWVTFAASAGAKASKLELHINMQYYANINYNDVNGSTSAGGLYLDRTLAHEFTHAAMAANIAGMSSLPLWFIEGSAELSHGADDTRAVPMVDLLNDPSTLQDVLDDKNTSGDNAYAAGYMILRYMAKEGAAHTGTSQVDVVKKLMSELATSGATGFDGAISSATGGKFSGQSDLISQFMSVARTAPYTNTSILTRANFQPVLTFMKNNFGIDTPYFGNLTDVDTGAITGSDAGGATPKDAESVVPELTTTDQWTMPKEQSTTFSGLRVIWPDGTITEISSEGSYTYGKLHMTAKNLKMQVGTKANQATAIGFYDMRTKSLGTLGLINATKSLGDTGYFVHEDDEERYYALSYDKEKQAEWLDTLQNASNKTLDDISVTTKKDANIAIRVLDGAIDYALEQQTDIGSYLQRFDYTGLNVTTMTENIMSAESVIRDADMAKEMTDYTKNNVLMQSAQSMLAQANQSLSQVLSLLQ